MNDTPGEREGDLQARFERRRERRHKRRLRIRRRGRKAYIRSVYFLPSLATLGNAICGFGAIYVAHLDPSPELIGTDPWTIGLAEHRYLWACYLVLMAMLFDALDGRLARWTRHTTDFGGQLDSLADVISFGAAPAMIALAAFKHANIVPDSMLPVSRLVWAIGAFYLCCAAMRLARFNTVNEHGEQHHFSFLGLPSPGAAAAVIGLIFIQQDVAATLAGSNAWTARALVHALTVAIPLLVLACGMLMVSNLRYPHLINTQLRGRKSFGRLVLAVVIVLALIVQHRYTFGIGAIIFALSAPALWAWGRYRPGRKALVG